MSYTDTTKTQNPKTAIAAVAIIHAAIGAVFITGLSTVVFQTPDDPPLIGKNVEVPLEPLPVPPPPPDRTVDTPPAPKTVPVPYMPPVPLDINPGKVDVTTGDTMALDTDRFVKVPTDLGDDFVEPSFGKKPDAKPAMLDPLPAKPINSPGSWVSTNDYKSVWINREWTGTARFAVTVGTNGRVTDCRIVSSTGHEALDAATCKLVKQRAKFAPARNGAREKIAGTYTNAIRWELPD